MEKIIFLVFASSLFANATVILDKDCEETANIHTCQEGYEIVSSFIDERVCWIKNCRKCPEIEIGCLFGPLTFEKNTCKPKCKPNPCDVANCPPGYGCRLSYRTQNGIREYYSRCYERERVCFQPHTKDDCGKNITRYYYNDDVKDCLPFIDTGCGKSENNHVSLQSCRKSCYGYRCKLFRCRSCPHGYKYDEKDCQTCECLPSPRICSKISCNVCPIGYKKDRFGCQTCECLEAPMALKCIQIDQEGKTFQIDNPNYFYDRVDKRGCTAGPRGYSSLDDCQKSCQGRTPLICKSKKCNSICKYRAIDKYGCPTCVCPKVDTCKNVKCASGHICKIQILNDGFYNEIFKCVEDGEFIEYIEQIGQIKDIPRRNIPYSPLEKIHKKIKEISTRSLIAIAIGFGLALTAVITTIVFISSGKYKTLKNDTKHPLA
ncbi:DgyrCDS10666 [Dimorphilus gyrociliatus]|uniref:DgyrCDS10666 n=1 Tax=Dimorphilus gyrociliatus TaxID=2664684 RepID=A0A7I8W5Y7_9ANNE|nr:DgyrCDS10666 [Dimorphilus gyrociliatus]